MSGNTLSPWDLTGLSMGFGLYRPRRPSYTFATQHNRQRSESYRHATHCEAECIDVPPQRDFIESVLNKKLEQTNSKASKNYCHDDNHIELNRLTDDHLGGTGESSGNDVLCETQNHINQKYAAQHSKTNNRQHSQELAEVSQAMVVEVGIVIPSVNQSRSSTPSGGIISFKKNLVVLSVSFILIFSSFRGVQNLQSSLNAQDQLGIIAMSCVHGAMVLTCLLSPIWTSIFTAKWTMGLGSLCFLLWFGANFYPTFYTLIPASVIAGFGHGLLWTAETSYILQLSFDSIRKGRHYQEHKIFRYHAVFLACFQTTHIWGNLISSLLFGQQSQVVQYRSRQEEEAALTNNMTSEEQSRMPYISQCGVLYQCQREINIPVFPGKSFDRVDIWPVLWKLMCAYLVMAFIGFCLILFLLDRIGSRTDLISNGLQNIKLHVSHLVHHQTFRLLIPLLVFSGLQQGFIYSDYNQYFVTCSMGVEYIGYCMITLGVANVAGAVVVVLISHHLPREVALGFGGIMHIALMIGFLIWIPDKQPLLFFVLAAAWGVCDAVWQTQCNTLLCLTCAEAPEVAFANSRMLQSLGLTLAFSLGTGMCVAGKLYLLMTLLVLAIMFYVLAEYRLRHNNDDVFEDP